MGIRVALHHKTTYRYDRLVTLSPQVVRLRPAPHSRTPVTGFSLRIAPAKHFINWQQDPQGNFLARLAFAEPTTIFSLEVDLVAEMTVINPFDFLVALNQRVQREVRYLTRMEPGVQTSEETLALASGSCRDSAWLLVEIA